MFLNRLSYKLFADIISAADWYVGDVIFVNLDVFQWKIIEKHLSFCWCVGTKCIGTKFRAFFLPRTFFPQKNYLLQVHLPNAHKTKWLLLISQVYTSPRRMTRADIHGDFKRIKCSYEMDLTPWPFDLMVLQYLSTLLLTGSKLTSGE